MARQGFRTGVILALLGSAATAGWLAACAPGEPAEPTLRLQRNLGDLHHPITTSSAAAQQFFDQGLTLTFGFNHELAVESYREATRLDPKCAMCFWGIALALGPNINAPMGPEAGTRALEAVRQAEALAPSVSEPEQAYIAALATRYSDAPEVDRATLDRAYAEAMRAVHERYPDDLDAATLYAEAVMDLSPWDYWTEDGQPKGDTMAVVELLEAVLERDPYHPGANHYLIHALEEFDPQRAESAADRLAKVAPDSGHLVHMPSHIYWRVGRYEDAARINALAAAADEALFSWCRSTPFYQSLYYTHNLHFRWASALAAGQGDAALTAARRLESQVPVEQLEQWPFLEDFLAVPWVTLARLGRWDEILGAEAPPANQPFVTAVWHYVRGLAYAAQGDTEAAQAELAAVDAASANPELADLVHDPGGNTVGQKLAIARSHLAGEVARSQGDQAGTIAAFEQAVTFQDGLNYVEPPAWYLPSRLPLGYALLEAGELERAEAVFRANLQNYPRNGWGLYGLGESLRRQGRDADARWVQKGFERAWAKADVKLGGG